MEKAHTPPTVPNDWHLELLRGIAAVLVVIAHYGPASGLNLGVLAFAFTGVDLFFVLSGFVFAPYLSGKPLHAPAHFIRRLFRLYPLYALALACYAWLRWQPGISGSLLLKHALFLHTLESRDIAFHFNPAFWSLPPEVEFYLALPLLAACTGRVRYLAGAALLALFLHGALALLAARTPDLNAASILLIHLPGLLIEFLLGTLAWQLAQKNPGHLARLFLALLGGTLWWLLARCFVQLGDAGIENIVWLRNNIGLFAAASFALITLAWVGSVPHPPAWLHSLATFSGNLSYGVYLFHGAAPLVLTPCHPYLSAASFTLLCFAATVLTAYLLHRFWEAPWRRYGRTLAYRFESRP